MSNSSAHLLSEVASDKVQDVLLGEFERLGEEEVRLRLQFHCYDEETVQKAHDWLADREYSHFGDDIHSVRAYAIRTDNLARESMKLAEAAKQLAYVADAAAKEAQETARTINQAANAAQVQLSESTRATGVALIVAIIALAISVGALVFR